MYCVFLAELDGGRFFECELDVAYQSDISGAVKMNGICRGLGGGKDEKKRLTKSLITPLTTFPV